MGEGEQHCRAVGRVMAWDICFLSLKAAAKQPGAWALPLTWMPGFDLAPVYLLWTFAE